MKSVLIGSGDVCRVLMLSDQCGTTVYSVHSITYSRLSVTDILSEWRVCVYIRVIVRTNSCKSVVLQGCGTLQGSISYFAATRSSQMNAEAANDGDPIY